MVYKVVVIALAVLFMIAPAFAGIDESKLVDLTYPLDEQTVYRPGGIA